MSPKRVSKWCLLKKSGYDHDQYGKIPLAEGQRSSMVRAVLVFRDVGAVSLNSFAIFAAITLGHRLSVDRPSRLTFVCIVAHSYEPGLVDVLEGVLVTPAQRMVVRKMHPGLEM